MSIQEETQANIEILKSVVSKGLCCPMCGCNQFVVINGYLRHDIQTERDSFVIGGQGVNTVALICKKCGFLSQHVLSVLNDNI